VGRMRVKHGHGEGSSPALHGNRLVINWDHEGESFITALDTGTGEPSWTVARDEGTSWSTPLIVEHGDGVQVIVAATHRTRGYDLEDGRLIWECGGLSGNVVATPVAADGLVYLTSYNMRTNPEVIGLPEFAVLLETYDADGSGQLSYAEIRSNS